MESVPSLRGVKWMSIALEEVIFLFAERKFFLPSRERKTYFHKMLRKSPLHFSRFGVELGFCRFPYKPVPASRFLGQDDGVFKVDGSAMTLRRGLEEDNPALQAVAEKG